MKKKSSEYYISAGILFGIAGGAGKFDALGIIGIALIVIGFIMKKDNK